MIVESSFGVKIGANINGEVQNETTFHQTILEGIGFSLLGTIYAGFMFGFIDAVYNHDLDNQPGVVADYPREITLGLLWIFVGLIVSYFLIRFSLSNLSNLYCWLFTILFASILAVFIQNLYLSFFMIREYPGSPQLLS